MKKILCLLLVSCLLLFGCTSRTQPKPKVTVVEQNAIVITKLISNATDGYETTRDRSRTCFSALKEDFILELNTRAAEKGYPELTVLPVHGSYNRMYSLDNDTWYLLVESSSSGIEEIILDLYSNSKEHAKRNGDYLYMLIDIFNPGMQELITNELCIFDETSEDYPRVREVICGKATYRYTVDGDLEIKPTSLPETSEEKIPDAIKPQ